MYDSVESFRYTDATKIPFLFSIIFFTLETMSSEQPISSDLTSNNIAREKFNELARKHILRLRTSAYFHHHPALPLLWIQ